jgi:hypothetical protein
MAESKEYSWKRITDDELLSHGACELLYVDVEPSAANGRITFYDGESAAGEQIHALKTQPNTNVVFKPPEPIYCRRGLFVDIDEKVTAVFIQWRELGSPK